MAAMAMAGRPVLLHKHKLANGDHAIGAALHRVVNDTSGSHRLKSACGLVWHRHALAAPLDGCQALRLAVYSVRPQAGPVIADVAVFPGLNGLPRQVAGIDAPDFMDRNLGLRLAEAGFAAHVIDYCPGTPSANRQAELAALADRMTITGLPAGLAIARAAAWWVESSGICTSGRVALVGHSLGAYLATLAAGALGMPCDAVLASGVVPLDWLRSAPGRASPLHDLPSGLPAGTSFGSLLAMASVRRVQIQLGTEDTVFGITALRAGGAEVAQALGSRATLREFPMGHGTNASAAIAFLKEGPKP